jgi:hypothetical protein
MALIERSGIQGSKWDPGVGGMTNIMPPMGGGAVGGAKKLCGCWGCEPIAGIHVCETGVILDVVTRCTFEDVRSIHFCLETCKNTSMSRGTVSPERSIHSLIVSADEWWVVRRRI